MNLRTYTLSVSLAAIVGLLLTVTPLVRSVLEYRSPSVEILEPKELSSVEMLIATKAGKDEARLALHYGRGLQQWQAMYDAAKAQHEETVRQQIGVIRRKAAQNAIAYGSLAVLSLVLLITHLFWARRV